MKAFVDDFIFCQELPQGELILVKPCLPTNHYAMLPAVLCRFILFVRKYAIIKLGIQHRYATILYAIIKS